MLRFLSTLITIGTLGYGAWWLNDTQPHLKQVVLERINIGNFSTFEPRFTAKQIMEKQRLTLSNNTKKTFPKPHLTFHPYLLMDVKFTDDQEETKEGVMLWDLIQGEMVINTKHWETTHGFADCIHAKASPYEYTMIQTIAKHGGKAEAHILAKALEVDRSLADTWIRKCQQKKLIVKQKDGYRIHLQNPLFHTTPSTEISTPLITKNHPYSKRIRRRYSPTQIRKTAQAAFGPSFAVRRMQSVFLPVYSIAIQNPDGSMRTTLWNALNGEQLRHHFALIE